MTLKLILDSINAQYYTSKKGASSLLEDIPSLRIEDAYKYSGISEASDILHTKVKSKATKEFI